MFRTHTCNDLTKKHAGTEVILSGWVHKRRDLGGVIFVDLRDRYGITQVVFNPDAVSDFSLAESLRYEYVIKVIGKVVKREKKTINKELATGQIEVHAKEIEILSKAKTLPFEIFDARKKEEEEELRLKHRYLELRREKLKSNILFRAEMIRHIRDFMEDRGYIDIATPILTVSSPEGARDYLVPSRLHPGKFYALPQAPQQYKQLLMVAGLDKYYQIAPCFRDEDPRADRSPGEFYQLDVESSFQTMEEFLDEMEPLFIELTEQLTNKKILSKPFSRIPYKEAMEKYGSDRPDLRYGLEIQDITAWAHNTDFNVFNTANYIRCVVVPEGDEFSRKQLDEDFTDQAVKAGAKGLAWLKFTTDFEGGIKKFFTEDQLQELKELLQPEQGSIILFVADSWEITCKALAAIREYSAEKLKLADENTIAWAWIVDFPMYEWNEEMQKIDFGHNPFSMPQGGLDALNNKDPLDILAYQYDIIANGLELSSGAVRNMDPEMMYKAFEIAGYSKDTVDEKFGHMIEAFEYGAPPHCGFAPGIDRLLMLLLGEKNIRSVIAFPKNQKAAEPMMGSPSEVEKDQLDELHIMLNIPKK